MRHLNSVLVVLLVLGIVKVGDDDGLFKKVDDNGATFDTTRLTCAVDFWTPL